MFLMQFIAISSCASRAFIFIYAFRAVQQHSDQKGVTPDLSNENKSCSGMQLT